jgi:hypothetical protein
LPGDPTGLPVVVVLVELWPCPADVIEDDVLGDGATWAAGAFGVELWDRVGLESAVAGAVVTVFAGAGCREVEVARKGAA